MSTAKSRPCQRCGIEIRAERIEVLPDTHLCVKCSKAVGGEFDLMITPNIEKGSKAVPRNGF